MKTVTKTVSGATALSAAIGLAMAMQGTPSGAAGMQDQMQQMHDDPQVMAQMQKFMADKIKKEHL